LPSLPPAVLLSSLPLSERVSRRPLPSSDSGCQALHAADDDDAFLGVKPQVRGPPGHNRAGDAATTLGRCGDSSTARASPAAPGCAGPPIRPSTSASSRARHCTDRMRHKWPGSLLSPARQSVQ
jgi:hypothetical protein